MEKKELRKIMINKRNNMDKDEKENKDNIIKNKLMKSDYYKKSSMIFIYLAYGSEINTIEYVKEFLKDGKRICIPRTNLRDKTMEAVEINSLENLKKDKYGILEPDESIEAIKKEDIDLIILPGVAFDKSGGRLGYGGGYYDKYLNSCPDNIDKVSLCYDFQIVDKVPEEVHDVKANYVIIG